MTVAGQPTVTYGYDNADRLTSITQASNVVSFAYDTAGRRTTLTLPNNVITDYAYDTASRVTGLTYKHGSNTLGTLTYTYDANTQRRRIGGTWARTGVPQALSSATYNAANHQLTYGSQTLTYDLNGNLTNDGALTYTWDARNRLAAISGSGSASFAYDALGRRRQKNINGGLTTFLYDGLNPVQESAGGGVTNLLGGLNIDEFLVRSEALGTQSLLADGLGSMVALADSAGTVTTQYTFEPFGTTTATGASSLNELQFTGRENDGIGVYYYRARYYHTGLQRFISEDPIGFAGGDANLYAYVANNPVTRRDPVGLTWQTNAEFLADFLTGDGATIRQYGPRDVQTREMAASIGVQRLREAFAQGGCLTQRGLAYGTFEAYFDTVANPLTSDWSSTAAQVGGFAGASIVRNPNGTITITIPNEAGAHSFFYHAVPNAPWQSGPLRTIRQTFQWTEAAPSKCTHPVSLVGRK